MYVYIYIYILFSLLSLMSQSGRLDHPVLLISSKCDPRFLNAVSACTWLQKQHHNSTFYPTFTTPTTSPRTASIPLKAPTQPLRILHRVPQALLIRAFVSSKILTAGNRLTLSVSAASTSSSSSIRWTSDTASTLAPSALCVSGSRAKKATGEGIDDEDSAGLTSPVCRRIEDDVANDAGYCVDRDPIDRWRVLRGLSESFRPLDQEGNHSRSFQTPPSGVHGQAICPTRRTLMRMCRACDAWWRMASPTYLDWARPVLSVT